MDDSRLDQFIAPRPVIAGRELRLFSAGVLRCARKLDLRSVGGEAASLSRDELEAELVALWLLLSEPLEDVKRLADLPRAAFFANHVEPILFDFPAVDLQKMVAVIERAFADTDAANFDVANKPGASGGSASGAPPNS